MENSPESPPIIAEESGWSPQIRILFLIIWLGIALGLVLLARPLWWLLVLMFIVGYLVQPVVGFLQRLFIPRGLATILTLLMVIVLVVLVPSILVPLVFQDIAPISIDWNGILQGIVRWTEQLPNTVPGFEIFGYEVALTPLYDQAANELIKLQTQALQPSVESVINTILAGVRPTVQVVGFATALATNVIGRTIGVLLYVILFILLTFYFTNEQPRIVKYLVQLAPERFEAEWAELWRRTGRTWSLFFRGQLILSIVIGVVVWLGLSILGIPGALALGVLAGVLELIPNLGPLLAAIPGVLMALLQGSTTFPELSNWLMALIVIGFYVIIQQIENLFLVPRILGRSVGIHAALVLLGVIVFTIHFGIIGAFVATPTLATLIIWFRFFHARILNRRPYPELATSAVIGNRFAAAPTIFSPISEIAPPGAVMQTSPVAVLSPREDAPASAQENSGISENDHVMEASETADEPEIGDQLI
ncbi:MAG: AI-2E family transporter [Caldilineales bacterium]|nr:AI-2E family transporter [Caldilineales bacterium]